jgi:hypothetical protein
MKGGRATLPIKYRVSIGASAFCVYTEDDDGQRFFSVR